MTLSEAFAAADTAAAPDGNPAAAPTAADAHARMRARGYQSLPVIGKVAAWVSDRAVQAWADLRSAWWMPASLPTLAQAWAGRMPDRERVPGDSTVLWRGWVGYNHTIALAVPALALAVVGVLTPLVWAARHPARFLLTAVIAAASMVLIFK